VSLFQENETSTTYKAVDLSKHTDVIIDISLKGKELHNFSLHCLGDENQKDIVNYDEMFDCEIDGNVYSCAVLRFENPTLGAYIKNEIDKRVFFFFFFFKYFINS
jgi:sulfatase maturation enzyme AslB (radical SAM superfamily)